jgi:DNA-binding FrmR family transcriptional regulator
VTKECERCHKLQHRTEEEQNNYLKRLNRIEGQVKGISKMITDNRHCDDILIQISAVKNAIESLGREILENHMKTCMVEDIQNNKYETIDEVINLFRRLK